MDSETADATTSQAPFGSMTTTSVIQSGGVVSLGWNIRNVTGVTITSDDVGFSLGAQSSTGSHNFGTGPTADNCWYLAASNSCGSLNVTACTIVIGNIPASCPAGLESFYTISEIATNGTLATFRS